MQGSLAARMMELYAGFDSAYGTYSTAQKNMSKGGKLEIRASAKTEKKPVTLELWEKHIGGIQSLGIIPIDSDNHCGWAAIDVDSYDFNHAALVEKIERRKLPLLVCKSKSGGAHVFVFFKERVLAREAQFAMKNVAATLGLGSVEIFPKQAEVLLDRGDFGSWLNMPYFGETRMAVKMTGSLMTLEEFIRAAERNKCELEQLGAATNEKTSSDFDDGPPCLQHLTAQGFPDGTRNNGLMALSVFAKKKFEANWQDKVEEWNRDFMHPPLNTDEVKATLNSAKRKDYKYSCKTSPLCDHCNSQVCVTRKYGVGEEGDFPIISGVTVMGTEPPLWFVDVGGTRIELETDDLQNYRRFHKVCMEKLYKVYPMLKQETWMKIINDAMKGLIVIDTPAEVGTEGAFREYLVSFCRDRSQDHNKDEILFGRVWESEEDNRYYFKLSDLMTYLKLMKFDEYTRRHIAERIRKFGGGKHFFNLKGEGVNVWYIPRDFSKLPIVDLPHLQETKI